MAETFVEFTEPVSDEHGRAFHARACGSEMPDARWQGWIEFVPLDGGEAVRSRRETTQPSREDTEYWATGLTPVYLEGALRRALVPSAPAAVTPPAAPIFDGPADAAPASTREGCILDPFSVYRKGEALLRSQLGALSAWHLVNIARAHRLTDIDEASLGRLPEASLVELIVTAVRAAPGRSSRS